MNLKPERDTVVRCLLTMVGGIAVSVPFLWAYFTIQTCGFKGLFLHCVAVALH